MNQSPNLLLPYILPAQAQKHVTHNEAIRALDAIVHLAVLDRDLPAPPTSSADGDRYLVASAATGSWSGHSGSIAARQDGGWIFYPPKNGWLLWVADEHLLLAYDGTSWTLAGGGGGGGNVDGGGSAASYGGTTPINGGSA